MTAKRGADAPTTDGESDGTTLADRRTFIKGVGATAATLATAGAASAQETTTADGPEWTTGRDGLAWSSDYVQDPYIAEGTLTRARHRMEWGADDDALTAYEDDSGEKAMLPGYVPREDTENVVTLRADKFDFQGGREFPRGEKYDADSDGDADEDVSALDQTHWSTTDATNGTVSVSNADLDVEKALTVSSSSVAGGETVTAAFSDFALSDAAEKRYLQFVVNVEALTSGATVEVAVLDDDGDEKVVSASPGADTSTASVFAAATGSGIVLQQRLADLTTNANGDGTFDSLDSVEVRIKDADATVTFTALDVERKSRWTFGSYLANEDTDSEERTKRYEPGPGDFTVTGLDTLGDVLGADSAVIHDVTQPFRYTLADSTLDYMFRFVEATDYPGYDYVFEQRGKVMVPTAIDLTHSGLTFMDEVAVPPGRYKSVWTLAGVEDTEFADMDEDSKVYHGGAYDSEGKDAELRSSVTADTVFAYGADLLVTEANMDTATSEGGMGGGGAAPSEKKDGGMWIFGGVFAGIAAFVAALRSGWA
ncbi:hypothetical protein [Halobaculum litoreum]|uniref:Tat (Twin-arginine translocation) pathway signal sequence n=1 Tax=Halobaculum litoreum TaxID=3031998 RepID=A0ABD5XJN9_9EURY|nr:hypothetical protein [Halobaculum sp. DT92]